MKHWGGMTLAELTRQLTENYCEAARRLIRGDSDGAIQLLASLDSTANATAAVRAMAVSALESGDNVRELVREFQAARAELEQALTAALERTSAEREAVERRLRWLRNLRHDLRPTDSRRLDARM